MKRDIKEYLHLYIGQEIIHNGGIKEDAIELTPFILRQFYDFLRQIHDYKLLLRPLSDMTEQDMRICELEDRGYTKSMLKENMELLLTPTMFLYLLKQGFDLFGLIDARLAIDKTTLKSQP